MTEPGDRSGDGAAGSSDWFSPAERAAAASGADGAWPRLSSVEPQADASADGDADLSLAEPRAAASASDDAWPLDPADSADETGRGPAELQLAMPDGAVADLSPADSADETELELATPDSAEADLSPADQQDPAEFRVRCPGCGPQRVAVADVRFVQTGDDAQANRYMFTCPECGRRVRRPAGPELAEVLRNAGVATLALHWGSGEAI